MEGRIRTVVDAPVNDDFAIAVRSDSYLDYGLDELDDRGHTCAEAGAGVFRALLQDCWNCCLNALLSRLPGRICFPHASLVFPVGLGGVQAFHPHVRESESAREDHYYHAPNVSQNASRASGLRIAQIGFCLRDARRDRGHGIPVLCMKYEQRHAQY